MHIAEPRTKSRRPGLTVPAILFPALFRLLATLPLRAAYRLGGGVGRLVYWLSPTYRRHLDDNLALAYPQGAPAGLAAEAARSAGRMMFEIPRLWLREQGEALAAVREVRGWGHLEAAWARGEGVVLLTPHIGCFEVIPLYFGTRAPMTFMFRPPKQVWLQGIVEKGRIRPNLSPVPADTSGVRLLMRALRRGQTVGILPDQVPGGGQGLWSTFFGKPAYTMTLAARLSEMQRVSVLLAFGERLAEGAGYVVHFLPPAVALDGDLQQRVDAINRSLEALILQFPSQFLWGYNRYKRPAGADAPREPT